MLGQAGKILLPVDLEPANLLESKLHVLDWQETLWALMFGKVIGKAAP